MTNQLYRSISTKVAALQMNERYFLDNIKLLNKRVNDLEEEVLILKARLKRRQ